MSPDPRYPIGRFQSPETVTSEQVAAWVTELEAIPGQMRRAVAGLSEAQLETPYREGGWTVRQVVHHVPDSQMHAYLRFKQGLTEDRPTIKPYAEGPTAMLGDYRLPLEPSLQLLEHVHARWVAIVGALEPEQLKREFVHPESGPWRLELILGMYAWHGAHHIAHITELRRRMGW
ncbi:MAG: putative metal-dependent hydrolase [Meiothermus sp.]|nr:putative metal-dependent hydrolase [Meiothermus sp.]